MQKFPIQFRLDGEETPYCKELLSKTWYLDNLDDARRLYEIRCLQALIGVDTESFAHKYFMHSIDKFDELANLKDYFDEKEFYEKQPDLKQYYKGDVLSKDNNSNKTIVVLSHRGHWAYSLYNNTSLENYRHPEYHYLTKNEDYNYISFFEDETRSYPNPILEPSSFYKGVNNGDLDSLQKMADFVKEKYPDTEYYVVSDCKAGHSSCILAEYLSAKKVFVSSPVTFLDAVELWDYLEIDGCVSTKCLMDINFIMYIRAVLYQDNFLTHQCNINSIAKFNPDIDFNINGVRGDFLISSHIRNIDETLPNVQLNLLSSNKWIHNNHHMLGWVRKQNLIEDYFSEK